jgi:hypothetical protein
VTGPQQDVLPGVMPEAAPVRRRSGKRSCVGCGRQESAAAWLIEYLTGPWCIDCRRARLVLPAGGGEGG